MPQPVARGALADLLLDFLGGMDCGRIVLVGDIVDGWRLRKSWYWDAHHDEVIRLVLRLARHGTRVARTDEHGDIAVLDAGDVVTSRR